jgi:alpha-tubulin suppressor-like RCC1 family protein
VPVQVPGLTNVRSVTGGNGTAFAVRTDGTVLAWGRNDATGELGNGTTGPCGTPPYPAGCRSTVPVPTSIAGVESVSAGHIGNFAIVT